MKDLDSWNIGKLECWKQLEKAIRNYESVLKAAGQVMNYKLNQKHPKLIQHCGLKAER